MPEVGIFSPVLCWSAISFPLGLFALVHPKQTPFHQWSASELGIDETAGIPVSPWRTDCVAINNNVKGHWNQVNASVDYALSKRTDVYLLGVYQIAGGHDGTADLQANIGSSQSAYFGQSGNNADNQVAARVGIRHKF
jgi:hypothetical protein